MLLIFTSGLGGRPAVDIDRGLTTIGRVAENDVQLADDKVSRHHAVIERRDGGRVVLRDLQSRNGSFVDGVRLSEPRVLTGGERLRFGDQELRVEAGSAGPALPPQERDETALEPPPSARGPAPRRIPRPHVGRRGVVLGLLAVAAILLVGVAQLVLPGVAEQRVRSDLSRYGPVRRVHIESSPAIKLLWHRADRVEVAMDSYRSEPGGHGSLADFLSRTRDTGKLDVSVGTLQTQLLTLHDVQLRKEGDALVGRARLTQRELSAALPSFLDLHPLSTSEAGIVAQASASVFGHRIAARIRVLADGGRVLVRPEGFPLGSLASITVFNDPRVYVESLGAELHGQNYLLTARARLK
jgi:pSer/pThr/pTyr-binding forkhead associated (FHA) protein